MRRDRSYPHANRNDQLIALIGFITAANSSGFQSEDLAHLQRAIAARRILEPERLRDQRGLGGLGRGACAMTDVLNSSNRWNSLR